MFFRRERPKQLTFQERLDNLKGLGFSVTPLSAGRVQLNRNGCVAVIEEGNPHPTVTARPGVAVGDEIAALVDGGFQKFFRTPFGKRKPALASELKALHDFQEDLREGLGLVSLYNESLGTVSTFYLYDRVKDRDHGVPKRVWES